MTTTHLIRTRRFLPLFITQLLGAFNDNLYKNAAIFFAVYSVYDSEKAEAKFSAIASLLFIAPFFLLSALAGQLADMRDKARIIRIIKLCEIGIMAVGGAGLILGAHHIAVDSLAIPLLLTGVLAMGIHSTFFGPIKYAILPQHLKSDEVLAGTGLVEAGTYVAVLAGTMLAGWISVTWAAAAVVLTAIAGYLASRAVPVAPPLHAKEKLDFHLLRASIALVRNTMHDRRIFMAILAISFFWTIGAVLLIQFTPLAKDVLTVGKAVASLFPVMFSIGVAIGSLSINHLLKGKVSARYAPASVLAMGVFIVLLELQCAHWVPLTGGALFDMHGFLAQPGSIWLLLTLLAIAVSGGMFVVPLYAFLTTFVETAQAARCVAANNIVNSGAMVVGAVMAVGLSALGVAIVEQLLLSTLLCLVSAWLAFLLYRAEQAAPHEPQHHLDI
jgi:MFS family permease